MAVSVPSDRRFRRAHVRPARRRSLAAARLRLAARLVAIAAVLAGAGWYGTQAMAKAQVLAIDEIEIEGNRHLPDGEVRALLAGLQGQHILLTDLEAWRQRLMGSPWVEQAALRRVLPSTIEVVISERTPMALARIKGELYLVDRGGRVIDAYGPGYGHFDLPIVDGLADETGPDGPAVDPARAALAARLLAALAERRDLLPLVSQIDVSDSRNAVVLLRHDPALLHLGDTRFAERLQAWLDLSETLRLRVPEIEYADLRFEDRVYVRPARGSARTVRAVNAGSPGTRQERQSDGEPARR